MLINCILVELVYVVVCVGYDVVSLCFIIMNVFGEFIYFLLDKVQVQVMKMVFVILGFWVLDIELVWIMEDCDLCDFEVVLEIGGELGVCYMIMFVWIMWCDDWNFLFDIYVEICDLVVFYGLMVDFEFLFFFWFRMLDEVFDIVWVVDWLNGGILVDMLYLYFS